MYIYIYTYIYTYIHIYIYMCIYIHTYIHTRGPQIGSVIECGQELASLVLGARSRCCKTCVVPLAQCRTSASFTDAWLGELSRSFLSFAKHLLKMRLVTSRKRSQLLNSRKLELHVRDKDAPSLQATALHQHADHCACRVAGRISCDSRLRY